jgi:hypothetical protein
LQQISEERRRVLLGKTCSVSCFDLSFGIFFLQGDQWLTPIGIDVVNVGVSSSSCFFILTPWGQEQTKLKVIDRFQKTFYPKICMRF